jgi:hypothetical protein
MKYKLAIWCQWLAKYAFPDPLHEWISTSSLLLDDNWTWIPCLFTWNVYLAFCYHVTYAPERVRTTKLTFNYSTWFASSQRNLATSIKHWHLKTNEKQRKYRHTPIPSLFRCFWVKKNPRSNGEVWTQFFFYRNHLMLIYKLEIWPSLQGLVC